MRLPDRVLLRPIVSGWSLRHSHAAVGRANRGRSRPTNAFAGFWHSVLNLIADPTLPADQRTVARWFNISGICDGATVHDRHGQSQSDCAVLLP